MEKSSLLGVEERKIDDLALRMGKEIWDDFSNASFMYVEFYNLEGDNANALSTVWIPNLY